MSKESSVASRKQGPEAERGHRQVSPSGEPIAIVGMACRFPGAPDLPSFWRLLEAGDNAVAQVVPGVRRRARRGVVPGRRGAERSVPFRCLPRRDRPVRRPVLPDFARGGATAGPATEVDAGNELAGSGGRGNGSGPAQGQPHRSIRRHQQQRLPRADPGRGRGPRTRRQPLRRQRHFLQHGHRTGCLRAGPGGTCHGAGHRLLVVAGGDTPGGVGPAAGRGRSCPRRRRAHDPVGAALGTARQCRNAGAGRTMQDVRRRRERVRAGRGLRDRGVEAAAATRRRTATASGP